jgi:hypothetical protein
MSCTRSLSLSCYSWTLRDIFYHIMRINDRAFDGSTTYLLTAQRLRNVVGGISGFSEFTPVYFPHREAIFMLMRAFLMGGNCFFITGTYVCHVAGVLSGYRGACLYICLTDTHLVHLLFQRAVTPTFTYADFHFELLHSVPNEDLFIYTVTRGSFSMRFFVFGIDVSARCGPLANVNLVYFVWDNYERMSTKQYAITLVPADTDTFSTPPGLVNAASLVTPTMICLKHYRAGSDGWRDGSNCDTCVESYRSRVESRCGCSRAEDCACRICLRQPPSLFSTALDVYTRLVHHLPDYELTSNTTYEQYIHAVESEQTSIDLLLPPEFPEVRIWFRFATPDFDIRFHRDCPGDGEWNSETCRTFTDVFDAVDDLVNEESTYWCHFCHRGLFFPNACPDPLHLN